MKKWALIFLLGLLPVGYAQSYDPNGGVYPGNTSQGKPLSFMDKTSVIMSAPTIWKGVDNLNRIKRGQEPIIYQTSTARVQPLGYYQQPINVYQVQPSYIAPASTFVPNPGASRY